MTIEGNKWQQHVDDDAQMDNDDARMTQWRQFDNAATTKRKFPFILSISAGFKMLINVKNCSLYKR